MKSFIAIERGRFWWGAGWFPNEQWKLFRIRLLDDEFGPLTIFEIAVLKFHIYCGVNL